MLPSSYIIIIWNGEPVCTDEFAAAPYPRLTLTCFKLRRDTSKRQTSHTDTNPWTFTFLEVSSSWKQDVTQQNRGDSASSLHSVWLHVAQTFSVAQTKLLCRSSKTDPLSYHQSFCFSLRCNPPLSDRLKTRLAVNSSLICTVTMWWSVRASQNKDTECSRKHGCLSLFVVVSGSCGPPHHIDFILSSCPSELFFHWPLSQWHKLWLVGDNAVLQTVKRRLWHVLIMLCLLLRGVAWSRYFSDFKIICQ